MLKIKRVRRGSLAKELGFQPGDIVTEIDGYPAEDELDYLFYNARSSFTIKLKDERQEHIFTVEKGEDEDLGIEVESLTPMRTCRNHCIFCFVDQMPKGMRESLYVKDDDYSMSFSCGNFVTLTNMSDADIDRVIRLGLSPLYVSVQAMNPALRCKLLNNRFAGKIKDQLKKLTDHGIEIHCQAVIVPNLSDGEEFAFTARELFSFYPMIKDLAAVPTGITKYREGLYPIEDITKESAMKMVRLIEALNREFGVNFLLPADEYYIRAELPMPDASFYGDFEQVENGIGMTAKFRQEFYDALQPCKLKRKKISLTVCGTSAKGIMEKLLKDANGKIENLDGRVLSVVNRFFGETVTCTGLLTGGDIYDALLKYEGAFDEVILPANTMKEFEDVFLDDMTLDELKRKLKFKNIRINRGGGEGFFHILSTLK